MCATRHNFPDQSVIMSRPHRSVPGKLRGFWERGLQRVDGDDGLVKPGPRPGAEAVLWLFTVNMARGWGDRFGLAGSMLEASQWDEVKFMTAGGGRAIAVSVFLAILSAVANGSFAVCPKLATCDAPGCRLSSSTSTSGLAWGWRLAVCWCCSSTSLSSLCRAFVAGFSLFFRSSTPSGLSGCSESQLLMAFGLELPLWCRSWLVNGWRVQQSTFSGQGWAF